MLTDIQIYNTQSMFVQRISDKTNICNFYIHLEVSNSLAKTLQTP